MGRSCAGDAPTGAAIPGDRGSTARAETARIGRRRGVRGVCRGLGLTLLALDASVPLMNPAAGDTALTRAESGDGGDSASALRPCTSFSRMLWATVVRSTTDRCRLSIMLLGLSSGWKV